MALTRLTLPAANAGQHTVINVHHFGPENGQKVYIQAGLHADEHPGLLVAQHLLERLSALETNHQLNAHFVVVPYANPIGLKQRSFGKVVGRCDWHTGQNFNRGMALDRDAFTAKFAAQFSSDAAANDLRMRTLLREMVDQRSAGFEVESLHKLLLSQSIDAHYVIDLHCDVVALPHVFYGSHQPDEGRLLARCLNFPVCLEEDVTGTVAFDATHTQPWVLTQQHLTDTAFAQPCFAATVELRGNADVSDELAKQDCDGLLAFFAAKNLISGLPVAQPSTVTQTTIAVEQVKLINATAPGIVTYHCQLNDHVRRGDNIADIVLLDEPMPTRVAIIAPCDGLVFSLTNEFYVSPGQTLAMLATDEVQNKAGSQLAF